MKQKIDRRMNRQGRIFPEYVIPPEELARREAEDEIFFQRCQEIFKRVYPKLADQYYGWFIIIEADTGDYFLDPDDEIAFKKARQKYPKAPLMTMRVNEDGSAGRI